MRALAALLGLTALALSSPAAATSYDFAFNIIEGGAPEPPVYFRLDSDTGQFDPVSAMTKFYDVSVYGADGSLYETEDEVDINAYNLTGIQYSSSGVNFTSIFFSSNDEPFNSGTGSDIQFLPGYYEGATLAGRTIFPARLNVSLAGAAPEPQTWLLMAAGVGLAGGALRRRRALVAPA